MLVFVYIVDNFFRPLSTFEVEERTRHGPLAFPTGALSPNLSYEKRLREF